MPAENASRAFALVLVDELVRQGVRHAVIAPGSRSTPVALALLENPHIEVHVRIDERSAGFLALGIAKASGFAVPVLCTSGTATSHLHAAVLEADLSRVPLLVLTADRPPELHGIGANQTVEQTGMFGGAVRWAPDVPVPEGGERAVEGWRDLVETAVDYSVGLMDSPPGPVHLNLPLREPLVPVEDGVGFPHDLYLGATPPAPESEEEFEQRFLASFEAKPSAELNHWIAGARSGVIVCGGGGNIAYLRLLASRAGWPIIAEPHSFMRKGNFALRSTDGILRDEKFIDSHRPDLVVVAGRVGLSRTLLQWLATVPHIVITEDGSNWDVTRTAKAVLAVDGPAVVAAAEVVTRADAQWLEGWRAASNAVSAAVDRILNESNVLTEPRVAREVAELVPEYTYLVASSSMPIRDLDLVMRPRTVLNVWANRGVSGIDGFVSTVLGIALGRLVTDGPVVALCGDLSLLHDINGLMPGPDPRPDVTFVVINNDGGGIFSVLPQAKQVDPAVAERLWGTPHGMSIEKVAAAYDVDHTLVRTAAELASALSSFGGVRIIEVRTDRAANAALHERLRSITASDA